jgi:hypothetical protein
MNSLRSFLCNACLGLTRYKERPSIRGVAPNPLENKHCKSRNACNAFAFDGARTAGTLQVDNTPRWRFRP